jgi:hypothetical protein
MTNLLKKLIPNGKDHTLEVSTFEGNITNFQMVTMVHPNSENEAIVVGKPNTQPMTRLQALVHAAWIVACADQSENFQEFRQILKAVLET